MNKMFNFTLATIFAGILIALALTTPQRAIAQNSYSNPSSFLSAPTPTPEKQPAAKAKLKKSKSHRKTSEDEAMFTKALNIMATHGYEGIANLSRSGDLVRATVLIDGHTTPITVNVTTSEVTVGTN